MSDHLTAIEKHDAAYGFAGARHRCDDCDRDVASLLAERDALARIFAATPSAFDRRHVLPRHSTTSRWIMIPVAASLLAGLVWMLAAPPQREPDPFAPVKQGEFVPRLARELSSATPSRRAIARSTLKAMGGAALPALDAAGTIEAQRLADEIRGFKSPLLDKLRAMVVDLHFENAELLNVLESIREVYQVNLPVNLAVQQRGFPLDARINLKVRNAPLGESLERALKPVGLIIVDGGEGGLVLTTPDLAPKPKSEGIPLRLRFAVPKGVDWLIEQLGHDSPEARDEAAKNLFHPGAEAALWGALDHKDPEIASRAGSLLTSLYTPTKAPLAPSGVPNVPIEIDAADLPLTAVLEGLRDSIGMPCVLEPGIEDLRYTFRARNIHLEGALRLMLNQHKLDFQVTRGALVILRRPRLLRTERQNGPLLWVEADRAATLSDLLNGGTLDGLPLPRQDLISPIRYAQRVMNEADSRRLEALAEQILDSQARDHWFVDEPAAWQRQKNLTAEGKAVRRKLEETKVEVAVKEADLRFVLGLMKDVTGIEFELGAPSSNVTIRVKEMPAGDLLELLIRPRGLEARIVGKKVVVK